MAQIKAVKVLKVIRSYRDNIIGKFHLNEGAHIVVYKNGVFRIGPRMLSWAEGNHLLRLPYITTVSDSGAELEVDMHPSLDASQYEARMIVSQPFSSTKPKGSMPSKAATRLPRSGDIDGEVTIEKPIKQEKPPRGKKVEQADVARTRPVKEATVVPEGFTEKAEVVKKIQDEARTVIPVAHEEVIKKVGEKTEAPKEKVADLPPLGIREGSAESMADEQALTGKRRKKVRKIEVSVEPETTKRSPKLRPLKKLS